MDNEKFDDIKDMYSTHDRIIEILSTAGPRSWQCDQSSFADMSKSQPLLSDLLKNVASRNNTGILPSSLGINIP